MSKTEDIYINVDNMLKEANKYGLMTEVVVFAIMYAKKYNMPADEAIAAGMDEWIK